MQQKASNLLSQAFSVHFALTDFTACPTAGFEKDERELMEEPDIETSAEVSTQSHACTKPCNCTMSIL